LLSATVAIVVPSDDDVVSCSDNDDAAAADTLRFSHKMVVCSQDGRLRR